MEQPLKVVLMAGGRGERFWPRSRAHFPKQFLDMDGKGSLLRRTFERLLGLVAPEDVYVATLAEFKELTLRELPELTEANLILEPVGRDTAASLGLAALWLERVDPNTIMLVLPADHMILEEDRFRSTLCAAVAAAAEGSYLITIGIRPTRPETGYGYIKVGPLKGQKEGLPVHQVLRFVEKPDAETAQRYLDLGDYLWNGGMFAWQVGVFRREIANFMPELHNVLEEIGSLPDHAAMTAALPALFPKAPKLSVDYGVMEKSQSVRVVPAYFGWDDLGTWATVERVREKDENGNILRGQVITHDSHGLIVEGNPGRLVAAVGVEDLIVVDTDDALLICAKDRAQDVKKVASQAATAQTAVGGRSIQYNWGQAVVWAETENYTARLLQVPKGRVVELSDHAVSLKTVYIQSGKGRFTTTLGSEEVGPGRVLNCEPFSQPQLAALSELQLIEISTPIRHALDSQDAKARLVGAD